MPTLTASTYYSIFAPYDSAILISMVSLHRRSLVLNKIVLTIVFVGDDVLFFDSLGVLVNTCRYFVRRPCHYMSSQNTR